MKLVRAIVVAIGALALAYVAANILMLGVLFAVFTGGPGCWVAPHPDEFVQDVWLQADPEDDCGTRRGMVDDLLANHVRPGMSREQVVALLGPQDDPDYGYMLGCWIDCDWVTIQYDADGHLTEARQTQD